VSIVMKKWITHIAYIFISNTQSVPNPPKTPSYITPKKIKDKTLLLFVFKNTHKNSETSGLDDNGHPVICTIDARKCRHR